MYSDTTYQEPFICKKVNFPFYDETEYQIVLVLLEDTCLFYLQCGLYFSFTIWTGVPGRWNHRLNKLKYACPNFSDCIVDSTEVIAFIRI